MNERAVEMRFPAVVIEDDPIVRRGVVQGLSLAGIPSVEFRDGNTAMEAMRDIAPGAVLCDVCLPGISGIEVLRTLRQTDPDLPVILMTGHGEVSMAVEAMRLGAHDFIEKPFSTERMVTVVKGAIEKWGLLLENRRLRECLEDQGDSPLVGQSPAMQKVRQLIATLAPTSVDILINGETGCGKEVVARAIHAKSERRGPFVAINCAAMPESVFESELFGHELGAFTGALKKRIGKFEYAHGGTLFLDEIESMPTLLQAKLLRVLQERVVERIGGNTPITVNCRVLAASKLDLRALSESGGFRADLYYRLHVASIDIPPLRDRLEDIPHLMAHFLQLAAKRYGKTPPEVTMDNIVRWQQHGWPGNVRELRNIAERWCLDLPDGLDASAKAGRTLAERMNQAEKGFIESALLEAKGNIAIAAEKLAVPKKTLYDKIARLGIDPERFRARP